MKNRAADTYVCFTCRKSSRRKLWPPLPVCPKCRGPMFCVGKHRLPKQTDDKAWKVLRRRVERATRVGLPANYYL